MSIAFDKDLFSSIDLIPEKLRSNEVYPKLVSMIDYIVIGLAEEFEDIKYKYADPSIVKDEVIKEVINELGFSYITNVMDTITNFEFNTLLEFVSIINLLKGSRTGLELVLRLLGLDSIITEWWEDYPVKEPYTFKLVIIADAQFVPDINLTLSKINEFVRAYVFPILENIEFRFEVSAGEAFICSAGFFKPKYYGLIMGRIP